MMRHFFLIFMLVSSIGCTNSDEIKIGRCSFLYDEEIHGKIIMPILEKEASGYAQYFNISNPVVRKNDGLVRVLLSPINTDANQTILYENSFIFLFDPCSGSVVDHFEVVRN